MTLFATTSPVVLLLCTAALPALLYAALFFDTRCRDLGTARGGGVHPSNGHTDAELVFGTRHGAFVDFDPDTTVTIPDRTPTLDDWHFTLRTTPTTAQVHYSRTTGSPDTRTVILGHVALGQHG